MQVDSIGFFEEKQNTEKEQVMAQEADDAAETNVQRLYFLTQSKLYELA